MKKYLVVTDSTTDLPSSYYENPNLKIIPLHFTMDGKEFTDGEIDSREFYQHVRTGSMPITSQLNPDTYIKTLSEILKNGQDVLVIAFSSGLSGTANSMRIAIEELKEEFPNRKIYGIDSLCASLGEGLLVNLALEAMEAGKSIEENYEYIENIKLKVCHWFTVEDLNHLRRGGRVSGFSAFIGTVLKIKPILHVNNEGRLIPLKKVIGRKKSIAKLFNELEQTIVNPESQTIYISHGDCLEEALELKSMIVERYKVKDVVINMIGTVIGSHSGPGTLSLFYLGEKR